MAHKIDEMQEWLKIDRDQLDEELIRQPEMFFRVSRELADAINDRDTIKDALNRIEAKLSDQIREEKRTAEEKFTVGEIADAVKRHEKYRSKQEAYRIASQKVDLIAALKEAFAQRSYVLKELASLWVSNYFQETSARGGDAKKVEEAKYRERRKTLSNKRVPI